ncbi:MULTISPECIES: hypothetical protein [unclassified Streptomyces]|nr:hypothetical protein [Streptomyces sp. DK15]MDX2391477.1 hypothetical protein [Streptomyces sp. DK15]
MVPKRLAAMIRLMPEGPFGAVPVRREGGDPQAAAHLRRLGEEFSR